MQHLDFQDCSSGNCYLLRASNIYIGVDLPEEESNDVRSWCDENDRIYKVTMAFRRVVNVAFGDQVVEFELVLIINIKRWYLIVPPFYKI